MASSGTVVVREAQAGSKDAFAGLFEQYKHQIYHYILRIMGSVEDANDLAQDTFLKAYVALPKTQEDMNFGPWLYRIATNVCRDELRRRKIIYWQPLEVFTAVFRPQQVAPDDPEGELLRKERAELVQLVLNKLSHRYRVCLVLRECQDLSCEEIGEVLGISRQAVKSLLFRAREEFRQVYRTIESSSALAEDGKLARRSAEAGP